jgi:hypothetical protein
VTINFGIVAITKDGEVLHFCGYENEPEPVDFASLEAELKRDAEFGLAERSDYALVKAPQEIVDFYAEEFYITTN